MGDFRFVNDADGLSGLIHRLRSGFGGHKNRLLETSDVKAHLDRCVGAGLEVHGNGCAAKSGGGGFDEVAPTGNPAKLEASIGTANLVDRCLACRVEERE